MKMYYFSRGSYNKEYHVMAKSPTEALTHLKPFLSRGTDEWNLRYNLDNYNYFETHPEYIYEFEEGQVVQTEVS